MSIFEQIKDATISGNTPKVVELANLALAEGKSPSMIIQEGFIAAMGVVGERFKQGEIYVPEMLIAARAMQAGLKVTKPFLVMGELPTLAKVIIGTVKGDLHDIGKNLVSMMIEGAGAVVIDLGVDVSSEQFVEAIQTYQPQFICMSALLTTTMPQMEINIKALVDSGLRDKVKVLIGGAPVSTEYALKIGADGYAANAGEAVDKIKELLK